MRVDLWCITGLASLVSGSLLHWEHCINCSLLMSSRDHWLGKGVDLSWLYHVPVICWVSHSQLLKNCKWNRLMVTSTSLKFFPKKTSYLFHPHVHWTFKRQIPDFVNKAKAAEEMWQAGTKIILHEEEKSGYHQTRKTQNPRVFHAKYCLMFLKKACQSANKFLTFAPHPVVNFTQTASTISCSRHFHKVVLCYLSRHAGAYQDWQKPACGKCTRDLFQTHFFRKNFLSTEQLSRGVFFNTLQDIVNVFDKRKTPVSLQALAPRKSCCISSSPCKHWHSQAVCFTMAKTECSLPVANCCQCDCG